MTVKIVAMKRTVKEVIEEDPTTGEKRLKKVVSKVIGYAPFTVDDKGFVLRSAIPGTNPAFGDVYRTPEAAQKAYDEYAKGIFDDEQKVERPESKELL